ncbi:O-antigen ligase family protein [Vreelandella utahensis]|uniref:O-antigen ligase family protein n=1 Tax=Vreelandella halophila TaxID=86177 RepID=UPI001179BD14|nr:O-antigen ligase family protein [Halomonas utahensis]
MDYWKYAVFPLAAGSLLLYALLWLPLHEGYRAAESVMAVLLLAIMIRFWRPWFRDDLFVRLWLVFTGFLILVQFWYAFSLPDTEAFEPSNKVTRHYIKPILILLAGVMVLQYGKRFLFWLGAAAVAGLLIYLAMQVGTGQWERALAGKRVDFHIRNAQHMALAFGTLLLAMACYLPRVITSDRSIAVRALVGLVFTLLVALGLFGVIVTKTRGVWLGLAGATVVCLGAMLLHTFRVSQHASHTNARRSKASMMAGVAVLALAVTALFALNTDERISDRLAQAEIPRHWENLTGDTRIEQIEMDNSGVRVATWLAATEWIQKRPLLGWSTDNAQDLIDQAPWFDDRFKERFGHLHNMHLEVFLAHGLIGGLLFYGLFAWIIIAVGLAYRRGTMPGDAALFGLGFAVYWAIANLFESYYLYSSGQYIVTIVFGFLYSFHFASGKTSYHPNGRPPQAT